jgi:outer membrane protein OmpA-like peptidoglycan-associated protein
MRLTALGKIILLILVVGIAAGAWNFWQRGGSGMMSKLAPEAKTKESTVPTKANLPEAAPSTGVQPVSTTAFTMPGTEPGCTDKPEVRWLLWAWNSQMGAMLANGGPQATKGSLMCKNGVNLVMKRQDDVTQMQTELVTFAQELKNGNPQPKKGAHFVAIMGDGAATFLKSLNDQLKRLGPEYTAKVVGSCGYSRGEDKFMGPAAWKANPEAARGGVVAGYLRDGDWNIAQKWLGDNGLKNNPDEKTYDPDALNWVAASDYIDAGQKYIAGYSETRPVVRNGKRTGEMKKITVQGVVTWTPGDVTVAKEKGGLVSVASTKEYSSQMPNTIIGINKWMQSNRPIVQGMLQAIMDGGDQVRSNPDALHYAAGISAKVYGEQDAAYWEKYYRGVTEADKTGQMVELGGSSVNNLADNLLLFGMVEGGANLFEATYTVFGDIVKDQYPELVPNYPALSSILDTSYLAAIRKTVAPAQIRTAVNSVKPQASQGKTGAVLSRRAWKIPFQSGKADFSPAAAKQLQQLRRDLLVAGGTTVEVHGHTDSQGNPQTNMNLSESRAFAVKKWLEKQSPVNFPSGRVRVFAHGQTNPVAPNGSEGGRAQNRRVEIVLTASK